MEVLHEDPHLLAVLKPGGIPCQADKTGDATVLDLLAPQFPLDRALGLPHRLDRPVSGALLVARTPACLAAMNMLFVDRAVKKTYLAVVEGTPPDSGRWSHRLEQDAHHHKARVVEDGRVLPSELTFERLAQGDRYALLELVPDGGRFHQLRAQCAAAGHPIKGDVKYGARRGEKDRTIALHAWTLAFPHPITREPMRITAPPPSNPLWDALLTKRGGPGNKMA